MPEPDMLARIYAVLGEGTPIDAGTVQTLRRVPGAYVLVMHLDAPLRFARAKISEASLSGWLIYAGSARGGGGIGARLERHFKKNKRIHWHVDELTVAANRLAAIVMPGGSECEIVERLVGSGAFQPALQGFGSTDCRRCPAHLLAPVFEERVDRVA